MAQWDAECGTYLQIAERAIGLLAWRLGIQIDIAGMQIAEVGWLLCVAHVDTIQQNVRAGAAQGLALTYSLPESTAEITNQFWGKGNRTWKG